MYFEMRQSLLVGTLVWRWKEIGRLED